MMPSCLPAGRTMLRVLRSAALLALLPAAAAQISLTSAVDLALHASPRVKLAADDVAKAKAVLDETRDVFIPAFSAGAGLGNSYGYSPYPPTLFTASAQSLVYNSSQFDYIRASKAGLRSAQFSLQDAREAVAEDVALTYAALDRDQSREAALHQQLGYVQRLVVIIEDRLAADRDTALNLTGARVNEAQLRLALLHAEDETATDRAHLASLLGMPAKLLMADSAFPPFPAHAGTDSFTPTDTPQVEAAFATARSKQQQAWGDSRFLYRPQFALVLQYSRYATFANSFKQIQLTQPSLTANEEVYGVQVTLPLLDRVRTARARESAADAARAYHEAENLRLTQYEGQGRTSRSVLELRTRVEVATLEQQFAGQQLDILMAQLASTSTGTATTPKDEQTARIAEREKYLAVLDASYQMRVAQINLLRQSGRLEQWLQSSIPPLQPSHP